MSSKLAKFSTRDPLRRERFRLRQERRVGSRSIDGSRSTALPCQAAQGLENRARVKPKQASSINIIDTIRSTFVLNAGISCLTSWDGAVFRGMERFRSLKPALATGEPIAGRQSAISKAGKPTHALCRVPQGRDARRSKPLGARQKTAWTGLSRE